ncbi:MAG: ATP-binding protein [Arachnia sp.]
MSEVLPDIPRSITALAEWLACLVYILVTPQRFRRVVTVAILTGGLAVLWVVQEFAGRFPLALWTLGMLLAVVVMAALIGITTRMKMGDIAYVTARAFVLAELVASLSWQVVVFYFRPAPGPTHWWALAILGVLFAITFGGAHVLERRHFSTAAAPDIGMRTLAIAIAMAVMTFALSNLSFVAPNTPFSGTLAQEVFYIRTLVDLCGYVALYAQHEQYRTQRADAELAQMNAILLAQHDQYLQAKGQMEQVNMTYHDLKHQVGVIRAEIDPERQGRYLDELTESIIEMESTFDTGNPVLDVVLTSKARYCQSRDISLTCVADGSALGFVEPMDLAAILGNAMDNAIEGVSRLDESAQRLIKVTIITQGALVMLKFQNYFDGVLNYAEGVIVTRKRGQGAHGLGLKSLRHTAAKYGGEATVTTRDGWFTLTVLLPTLDASR